MSLFLNFSAIDFGDPGLEAEVLPYGEDGAEFLSRLRQDHWRTHIFRREGADTLLGVPVVQGAPQLSEQRRRVRLQENLHLASALVRNALLTYLHSLQRPILRYDPIHFTTAKNELLQPCLPKGASRPAWLAVFLLHEMTVRPIYFHKRKPFVALITDLRTTRRADRTVAELLIDGFSPEGYYVVRKRPGSQDPRIQPGIELLGKIQRVSGTTLELTDTREGFETVQAADVMLERNSFDAVLQHYYRSESDAIKAALVKAKSDLRYGPNRLARIKSIVDHFAKQPLNIAPGIDVSFSHLLSSSEATFPSTDAAPKPVFVFDQAASKTSTWSDGGIDRHGPYTAKVFTPTRPHLCVVCLRANKGRVEQFLHKFLNGVSSPAGSNGRNYFEKGLLRKYQLQDVTYEFFFAEGQSASAYKAACTSAIDRHSSKRFDLALIQIEESFHDLPTKSNPYFITKESFLTHQIPVQEFEIETAQRQDRSLAICLNNMALATYAKLNGIPWLLKGNPTIAHELVIGLGSAQISDHRLGDRERFVGITTVFSGDGNYHLSSASRAVPFDNYTSAFKEALRNTIQKVRTDMNWRPKDHVRLMFHAAFKRFSDFDTIIVQQIVRELSSEYEVEYAFVEIHESHPYLLFDDSSEGKLDFETRGTKGVFAPQRSTILQLSNREALLSLTGPSEVKRPQDGLPSPLLVSLHRCSTFSDLTYITRQIFTFSCHSWRTFLPASLPVTIQYSDLIAKALGGLSQLDRWNPDVMIGRIGKTRWFL